jgi:hypothetical protein
MRPTAVALPFALGAALLAGSLAGPGRAATYQITPVLLLDSGITFTGTITTDDTVGALAPSNLTDWSVQVSGPIELTITPANSELNETVFAMVSAVADEVRVAFPDGNFQFIFEPPFTTTVPTCGNCDESGLVLLRSDFGRNLQGLFLTDGDDSDPSIEASQSPVVVGDDTYYVAATLVPEPSAVLLSAAGSIAFACAARPVRRRGATSAAP